MWINVPSQQFERLTYVHAQLHMCICLWQSMVNVLNGHWPVALFSWFLFFVLRRFECNSLIETLIYS